MAGDLLPYLKFFPAETLADERFASWTVTERGAWFTLILHAWTNGSIPDDPKALARILRMSPKSFAAVWSAIGDRFIPHPSDHGRMTSPRLEDERAEAMLRSEAGRTGARSRWSKRDNTAEPQEQGDATALRPEFDRNATTPDTAVPTDQHNADQHSTAHPQRIARVGVGSPAFEAVAHWTGKVWPKLSGAACPDVTTTQAQSLAVLSNKHGVAAICAAMDAAAADEFWGSKLDLDTFVAKHARWLARKAGALPPGKRPGMAPMGSAEAFAKDEKPW